MDFHSFEGKIYFSIKSYNEKCPDASNGHFVGIDLVCFYLTMKGIASP
jgi:hypothetical protein